jgi:hypothetical protein
VTIGLRPLLYGVSDFLQKLYKTHVFQLALNKAHNKNCYYLSILKKHMQTNLFGIIAYYVLEFIQMNFCSILPFSYPFI